MDRNRSSTEFGTDSAKDEVREWARLSATIAPEVRDGAAVRLLVEKQPEGLPLATESLGSSPQLVEDGDDVRGVSGSTHLAGKSVEACSVPVVDRLNRGSITAGDGVYQLSVGCLCRNSGSAG